MLHVGFAEIDYTPEPGLALQGQMHERRATHARDPLMVNACALRSGDETIVLVSIDICFLPTDFVQEVQALFAARTGVRADRLLIHTTHTHVAPTVFGILACAADPAFIERTREALVTAAARAVERLEPMSLFAGTGQMAEMGWNRRAMFDDGSSRMYGHSEQPGFIGMEGPRDPSLGVLFARDTSGAIRGVVTSFSTHPNAIEGACVYSADIPGASRRVLKRVLGPETVVLYLTGAAGNTAPSVLEPHDPEQPWRGEAGLVRSGQYLGGEALRVIAAATRPMAEPLLRVEQATVAIPIRPWPAPAAPSYPLPLVDEKWIGARYYYQESQEAWPRRLAEESPVPVRISVVRVGDAVLCTNPAELFVEFGLRIRERSPATVTLIAELTDGYVGYVPTALAFSRGGYETWAAPTSQLILDAGDQIVTVTDALLARAFA